MKIKNQSLFVKPNNFKSHKNHLLLKKKFLKNLVKSAYETNKMCIWWDWAIENGLKIQKNSKKYKQQITNLANTQVTEANKIISYYLNNMCFYFMFLY